MLIETGRVVALKAGYVWVETLRRSTCGSCAARAGCGQRLLNRADGGGRGLIRALSGDRLTAADCQVDDHVEIALPEAVVLRGSVIVYVTPIACALLAVGGLSTLTGPAGDAASVVAAVGGFALGLLLVRWHANAHRDDPHMQPVLQRRLSARQPVGDPAVALP